MSAGRALSIGGALAVLAAALLGSDAWLPGGRSAPEALRTGAVLARAGLALLGLCAVGLGVALHRSPRAHDERELAAGGIALLAVLALAALLRVIGLDSALWYDEIVTLVLWVRLPLDELLTTYPSTNNHMLYSLLAKACVALFGESAWALRLPAAAFGVASLAALWWVAREVTTRREALLAVGLVACSYHHVWFSQNARGYTGILFWCLLGTALFLRGTRDGARGRGVWIAYAGALAFGLYTHLSAVFVFFAHGLVYLAQQAHRLWSARGSGQPVLRSIDVWPLAGFGLGLAISFEMYALVLPQVFATFQEQAGPASGSAPVGSWKNPLWTLLEIVQGLQLGPASFAVAGTGALIGAAGFASYARRSPWAAMLMALPSAVAICVLVALSFNLWPRYFLVSIGFAALIGVRGIFVVSLAGARRWPGLGDGRRLATLASCAAIGLSAVTLVRNYQLPKQDYVGAREFVRAQHDAQPVVTAGLASFSYGRYYAPEWLSVESADELRRLEREHGSLWLVYSFETHIRGVHPDLFERIEERYQHVRSFPGTLGDGAVHVMRSRAADEQAAGRQVERRQLARRVLAGRQASGNSASHREGMRPLTIGRSHRGGPGKPGEEL